MRPSAAPRALLGLLLAGSALSWLALAAPVAAVDPSPSAGATAAAGSLSITQVGPVEDTDYPNIGVTYSIVDPANGRPVTSLATSNVAPSPAAQITSVTATSSVLPVAYVVAIDCSASMKDPQNGSNGPTYMDLAKNLANALAHGMGPNDLIKIVSFDQDDTLSHKTTPTQTAWLNAGDPKIASSISGINFEKYGTPLSAWLLAASTIANTPPAGVTRRAMVFITDADSHDTDAALSPSSLSKQLGPPTFVIGLHAADRVGAAMTQNLSDVATYTGGSYQTAIGGTDPTALYKPVLDSAHSTWAVKFHTNLIPDGNTNTEDLTITDAQQRSGKATVSYRSGGLAVISPVTVEGLAGGDDVTLDRTVTINVGGTREWKDARIDLFFDCDPDHCNPTLSAINAPLVWKMTVATMTRAGHRIVVRLTTTDDQVKYFTSSAEMTFKVSGTTWNAAAVMLIGGLAVLLTGAFFIAARRRSAPRNRRRAQ
jgi:von Willebrand factor type A domain